MKKISLRHAKKVLLALLLYTCFTSVLCCEASMQAQEKNQEPPLHAKTFSNHSFEEDITPMELISLHINSLMR